MVDDTTIEVLPPEYLQEHQEVLGAVAQVAELIGKADKAILALKQQRDQLAQERTLFEERIQEERARAEQEKDRLLMENGSLQQGLAVQRGKKEARITEHKKHHAAMMAELQKAQGSLDALLNSL